MWTFKVTSKFISKIHNIPVELNFIRRGEYLCLASFLDKVPLKYQIFGLSRLKTGCLEV